QAGTCSYPAGTCRYPRRPDCATLATQLANGRGRWKAATHAITRRGLTMSKKPNEPKESKDPKKPKAPKTPKDISIPLSERPTLSVNEFCGLVGIGRSTAYKAIKDRNLKLSKFGKRSFIKREEMLRFVGKM